MNRVVEAIRLGPTPKASLEQLAQEYQTHLALAQLYYRKALEASDQDAGGAAELRDKAQLYLGAAQLCMSEIILRVLTAPPARQRPAGGDLE